MTSHDPSEPKQRGPLERLLGLFAEVRAGEGLTAVLLTFDIFLILTAYYLLKTVREPLILASGGAELKSYTTAGQAIVLVAIIQVYGEFAKRVGRVQLITGLLLFFTGCLLVFYGLAWMKVPYLGIAFYLWTGCFNVTVIAQFWSFANDVYTSEQGKRLFAIVGVGSSLGAMLGAKIAKWMYVPLGPYNMMLAAGVLLMSCLAIARFVHARESAGASDEQAKEAAKPPATRGGFSIIAQDRYLILLAVLTLVLNLVNSTGEYILDRTLIESFEQGAAGEGLTKDQYIGTFKADFFFLVNTVGSLLQLLVVSRLFKYLGVRFAIFILPCIALGSYSLIAAFPILLFVRIGKTTENSVDYSIQNTARQALFLPTSREAKYSAKAVIDTFVVRIGDLLSAGLVFAGSSLHFSTRNFAMTNVALAGAWILLVVFVARLHKQREARAEAEEAAAGNAAPAAA